MGADPKHFDHDQFALAVQAKGIRTVMTFDVDDLVDCGQGDPGKPAAAERRVRWALREIAAGRQPRVLRPSK